MKSDISLRQLRFFVEVAEQLHFGKAATRLGIAQPSLTRQVQALEKGIGTALLERTSRSVMLTPAGRIFLEGARQTLEMHERSIASARNLGSRGPASLAIGFESCAPYHGLPERIARFLERYPATRVSSLKLSGPEQAEALMRRQIDLGFMHPPVPPLAGLVFETVADERFIVALPSAHRLAGRRKVACADLAGEPFALFPRELAPGCYDAIRQVCRDSGFEPRVAQESNEIAITLSLVASAGVVALFPECVRDCRTRGVAFRELKPSATIPSGFLRRAGNPTAIVRHFLELTLRNAVSR